MTTNIGQIKNPQIFFSPSKELLSYINNIKIGDDMPIGIKNIVYKNKAKDTQLRKLSKPEYLMTEEDKKFMKSLNLNFKCTQNETLGESTPKTKSTAINTKLLSLQDLHWLYSYIQGENVNNTDEKVYLHELMEGSEIILPKNEEIPRSEELDKRCQRLKAEQQNREYQDMTKNVDNLRRKLPEDTIGYQMKMMNKQLIAVFQFIVSVITGFAFGFIGIELLIGSLDFGFRLVLGIVCALTIALAELYFLAKKLNEEMEIESAAKKNDIKVD